MMSGSCLWISWGGFSLGWVVTWVHLQKQWLPVRPGQSCFWCRHKIPIDTKRLKFSNKSSLEVRNNEQTCERIFHWRTVIWTRSSSVLVSFDESHPLSILLIWKFLAIQRMQEQQVQSFSPNRSRALKFCPMLEKWGVETLPLLAALINSHIKVLISLIFTQCIVCLSQAKWCLGFSFWASSSRKLAQMLSLHSAWRIWFDLCLAA